MHGPRAAARRALAVGAFLAAACKPAPSVPPTPAIAAAEDPSPAAESAMQVRHDAAPVFTDPRRRERLAAVFPELRRRVEAFAADEELPGLAAGVVIDGELALFVGAGVADLDSGAPVTEHTVFRVASITKVVTATAILALRDQGKLSLDDPASRHVAELERLIYPTADARRITIRDLLLHTSGLPRVGDFDYTDPHDPPDRAEIVDSLAQFGLRSDPAAAYSYSNLGFALLGLVIQGVAGEEYTRVIDRMLLQPLGIEHAAWSPAAAGPRLASGYVRKADGFVRQEFWNHGAAAGVGGLYLDIADLARLAAFHLDAWPPRDALEAGPVRRSSLREMGRASHVMGFQVHTPTSEPRVELSAQGLSWSVAQDCRFEHVLSHSGGTDGYRSTIRLLPQRGVGVVVLANKSGAPLERLATDLLVALDDTGALARREPVPMPALTAAVERVTGLLAQWDGELARPLASLWFDQGGGLKQLEKDLAWARGAVGSCGAWSRTHTGAPDYAVHTATCERGKLVLEARVTTARGAGLAGVDVAARGVPAEPRLVAAAQQSVALLTKWDPERFAALFSRQYAREGFRQFLARANPERAACSLGEVEAVRPASATFKLRCGTHDLRLVAGKLDADGRLHQFSISPAPRDRCNRPREHSDEE
ncbi:serine hydrolase domain-containing protein [Nannocystis radixulma]|uniref:Serine hydrolase n=1 Tax=Nannocystis radixulma TaxID=2995305 RepID=A0ABT5B2Q8_9BACT|nr:serine hydrolase domain-containing protein [Nannocystis radixulma]MDC0668028.1 serine hydrolase [Nannocystis radixulma]